MKNYTKPTIPDKYVGKFTAKGSWEWSISGLESPMELYRDTLWATGKSGAYALYEPQITAVGRIRISAYIVGWSQYQDTNVEYEIHHASGVDRVYVDTSRYGKDESGWEVLGTFDFDGSGEEYVRLNRVTDKINNTRASTMRFEILNSRNDDAEVWQNLYVGPSHNEDLPVEMVDLNKFKDMSESPYKYSAEVLAYLEIIPVLSDCFNPEQPVTGADFALWLSNSADTEVLLADSTVSYKAACEAAADAAKKSGKNLEWLKSFDSAEDFVEKSEMLKNQACVTKSNALTRGEAVAFVKGYYHTFAAAGVNKDEWRLTFNDEFDGEHINTEVWNCENAVSGHILSSRWETNVKLENGSLKLLTKYEKHPQSPQLDWTTGSISVKPEVFAQCGGYWEASIKINASAGLNNAFWMAGNGNEIDIVEAHYKNAVHTNYHYDGTQYSENFNAPYDLSEDFHIYAIDWRENELIYYFDGKEISRKVNLAAHDKLYPFFSTAVLNWAGKIESSADGKFMEVEWVRLYEKAN